MYKIIKAGLISITVLVSVLFASSHNIKNRIWNGDQLGYYLYLPATFIYHNHTELNKIPLDTSILSSTASNIASINYLRGPKGYMVNQYTYGVAFMEMPFFFIAHTVERIKGLPANGYSDTYIFLIKVCDLVYAILGLLIIYRILRRYFDQLISLITVCSLFIGTNLFWFSLYQAGMAHVPLFFLYALLMQLTIKVHEKQLKWYFVSLGLVIGLITIIRPSDIVCVLIPLLYNFYNKEVIRAKFRLIRNNVKNIFLLVLAAIIPIIPQIIYWKYMTGKLFFDSYGGQAFNWSKPRILDGIFYASNGWLFYSPLMIFSLIGLFFYKYIRYWAWALWILLPLYIYITYSWYCYNYINGLGSRPMIHLYPLLAIPLAAVLAFVGSKRPFTKVVFSIIFLFFAAVNISYSIQEAEWKLHSEESNTMYNWQTLFRTKLNYNDLVVNDIGETQPDTTQLLKLATLECNHFEDSSSEHYIRDTTMSSRYVYRMGDEEYPQSDIKVIYDPVAFKDAKWFKCSGKFMCTIAPDYYKHVLCFFIKRADEFLIWKGCKIDNKVGVTDSLVNTGNLTLVNFIPNKWSRVTFFIEIPPNLRSGDLINLGVWNTGKRELFMDDICLEIYK